MDFIGRRSHKFLCMTPDSDRDMRNRIDLLSTIAEQILGYEDVKATADSIVSTLSSHLEAVGGLLTYNPEDECLYIVSASESSALNKVIKVVLGDLSNFKLQLKGFDTLLNVCIKEKRMVVSPHLRDFFAVYLSEMAVNLFQKSLRVKHVAAVPVIVDNKVIGVLIACFKKLKLIGIQYSYLKFYANLSGLALENSRKVYQLEEKYMQEKITSSMLSHELKTPIAIAHNSAQSLKLYLGQYRDELGSRRSEIECMQHEIESSIDRINYICESIFGLIESEESDISTIHELDFPGQLQQVLRVYAKKAEHKKLKFSYNFDVMKGMFYGGGVQLEQIITILLDNALKYTKEGSIHLNLFMDGSIVKCEVIDTGRGIPKRKRSNIFKKFYRCRTIFDKKAASTDGLGLGLYVAKRIVDKLEGSIYVQDNPSGKRGVMFTAELPVYRRQRGLKTAKRQVKTWIKKQKSIKYKPKKSRGKH